MLSVRKKMLAHTQHAPTFSAHTQRTLSMEYKFLRMLSKRKFFSALCAFASNTKWQMSASKLKQAICTVPESPTQKGFLLM